MQMGSELTIGIVVYDEITEISSLILNLKTEMNHHASHVLVDWIFILNHSDHNIRNTILLEIKNILPYFNYYENSENNLGFARNIILTHAKTELVYLTDPDIEHSSYSLTQLLNLAILSQQEKHLMGFTGPVIHQSTKHEMNSMFSLLQYLSQKIPFSFQIQNHSFMNTVDHAPTCHLLLLRSRALGISGFSENIYFVGEDLDFSHRAYGHGFRFLFSPKSKVIHHQNMNLWSWCKKVRNFGRAQIMSHKKNSDLPFRLYRLIPILFLAVPLTLFFLPQKIIFSLFLFLTIVFLLKRSVIYLGLTVFSYSLGEVFEIFYPQLKYKNKSEKIQAQNINLEKFSLQNNL